IHCCMCPRAGMVSTLELAAAHPVHDPPVHAQSAADKNWDLRLAQHIIQRTAGENLLKYRAPMTSHQDEICITFSGCTLQIVHGTVLADDIVCLHFMDFEITPHVLL